jgi:hypothetical protein
MKFEEGQIVWTCQPPIECGYGERLHKPHQVKISLRHTIWYGHGFNYETGEIDTDSNATIFAKETNCFLTKKEANDLYIYDLVCQINDLQDELKHFEENRED